MAKSSGPDETLDLNFTRHFDPATRVPEPAVSIDERKRLDEMGVIGATELDERGFFASIARSTSGAPQKAPGETTILVIEDDAGTADVVQRVLEKVGCLTRRAGKRAEIAPALGRR